MLIGAVIHQPVLAVPLAVGSHFVCDALPHFGFGKNSLNTRAFSIYLIADCSLAAAMLLLVFAAQPTSWLLMVICGIAAASPDLMWLPGYLRIKHAQPRFLRKNAIMKFHSRIQWSETIPGAIVEAVWFILVISLIVSQTN